MRNANDRLISVHRENAWGIECQCRLDGGKSEASLGRIAAQIADAQLCPAVCPDRKRDPCEDDLIRAQQLSLCEETTTGWRLDGQRDVDLAAGDPVRYRCIERDGQVPADDFTGTARTTQGNVTEPLGKAFRAYDRRNRGNTADYGVGLRERAGRPEYEDQTAG